MTSALKFKLALMAFLAMTPVCAWAHNPQIQIGVTDGKIVTHGLFLDEPYQDPTPPQRVYQIQMGQRSLGDADDGWYAEPNHDKYPYAGPGAALIDNNFAANSILKVSLLDGLKIWNGSTFVDPGAEQIAVSTSSLFTGSVLTSDTGPFGSISLAAVTGAAGDHKTLRWRLLGDGISPNTSSDDGVYLLKLQLSTDEAGIVPSDPYYFLLNKNASAEDLTGAFAAASVLVPEPAALGIVALGGLLWRRRFRR